MGEKMKKLIYIFAIVILLSGCATLQNREKALQSWIGSDVNSLIQSWGPPIDVFELPNGNKMYTWFYDSGAVAMPIGNMAYAVNKNCKITMTVDRNNIVQSWRYEGNACAQY